MEINMLQKIRNNFLWLRAVIYKTNPNRRGEFVCFGLLGLSVDFFLPMFGVSVPIPAVGAGMFAEIALVHAEHDGTIFRLPLLAVGVAVGKAELFHHGAARGVVSIVRGGHIGESAPLQRAEKGEPRLRRQPLSPEVAAQRIAEVAALAAVRVDVPDGLARKAYGAVHGSASRVLRHKPPHEFPRVRHCPGGEPGQKEVRPLVCKEREERPGVLLAKFAQREPRRRKNFFHR